jgi:zinc D-Ala-D-Ala dipeptidase
MRGWYGDIMKRHSGPVSLSRRHVALGIAILPLTTCITSRPDKDVPFRPASKQQAKPADADPNRLVELITLDPAIRLDLRYATPNNFTGRTLYTGARAALVSAAADALARASMMAKADGFGLNIYDAYRPWRVTKQLWDATPPGPKRNYVANPKRGSRHNRGCAVDLTLYDLATGKLAEMPTEFDDFSEKAHRDYSGASSQAIQNRKLLESHMQAQGFIGMSNEWWHFDFKDWERYPVMDIDFSDI